ncbi:MAG: DNA-primase RepB domain-containing protein, partial [Rectinemataceae bacterium]|nr:DNA-primase RepB domain-containing protein [Rectinemataceae bacterium]
MSDLGERLVSGAIPFLACLNQCSRESAWKTKEHWQTFDEDKSRKAKSLACLWQESINDAAPKLEQLNGEGAGIFLTINRTDGKGRKKQNVQELRGWWVDIDVKDAKVNSQEFDLEQLPLEPTMVVKTPGGWHIYWLAVESMSCANDETRRNEHEAELKGIQSRLAHFGADKNTCTVHQVLRLPGFWHRKGEPRSITLLKVDGP